MLNYGNSFVGSARKTMELFADVRQKFLLNSFMFYDYIMRLMNSFDGSFMPCSGSYLLVDTFDRRVSQFSVDHVESQKFPLVTCQCLWEIHMNQVKVDTWISLFVLSFSDLSLLIVFKGNFRSFYLQPSAQ